MAFEEKIASVNCLPAGASSSSEFQFSCEPRKRILLVDNGPASAEFTSSALHSKGYEVISARDGSEAICSMRDESPDMMLVHVCLPPAVDGRGMGPWTGFQVIQWGLHINARRIPAIVISQVDNAEYRKWASVAGAERLVAKSLDAAILLGAIESVLADALPESWDMSFKMAV